MDKINNLDHLQDDLRNGNLDAARLEVERLLQHQIYNPELTRLLGMLEVLTGYPHLAIARWERMTPEQLRIPEDWIQQVRDSLPDYEALYTMYNAAVELSRENRYIDADKRWEELFERGDSHALPVVCYQGYYLFLQINRAAVSKIRKHLLTAPAYVQQAPEIRVLVARLRETETVTLQRGKKRWIIAACCLGILLMGSTITGISLSRQADDSQPPLAIVPQVTLMQDQPVVDSSAVVQLKQRDDRLQQQESQISRLNSELVAAKVTSSKLESLQELLTTSGIDPTRLQEQAALSSYRKGRAQYNNKEYEQALVSLKDSLRLSPNEYYSDDTMYLLIEGLKSLGRTQEANGYVEQFLGEQGEHYKQSPYMDDLMLQKAITSLQTNELVEAKSVLEQIILKYPKEWTAREAIQILQQNKLRSPAP